MSNQAEIHTPIHRTFTGRTRVKFIKDFFLIFFTDSNAVVCNVSDMPPFSVFSVLMDISGLPCVYLTALSIKIKDDIG